MTTINPSSPRRSRLAHRRHAFVVALLAVTLPACGGADEEDEQGTSSSDASTSTPSSSPTSTSGVQDAGASDGTPIRITFGDTELTGRLLDDATARDLAAQLPLTLSFRDHNSVEKTAPLPRELSVDDAPAGHDLAAGDIDYWPPVGTSSSTTTKTRRTSTASCASASSAATWDPSSGCPRAQA